MRNNENNEIENSRKNENDDNHNTRKTQKKSENVELT